MTERWPRYALALLLAVYGVLCVIPGLRTNFDSSDGYDFIVESRRAQNEVPRNVINWERPRALVAVLMAYDRIGRLLASKLPSLTSIHGLMCLITLGYFLAWYVMLASLFDETTALLAIVFLMTYRALFKSSYLVLSDIFTGLWFALSLLSFRSFLKKLRASAPTAGPRLWLAFSLTMVALGKHQVFIFVPMFMTVALLALLYFKEPGVTWKKATLWLVDSMWVWALTTDALVRLTSGGEESGWTYVKYLFERTRWALAVSDFTPKTTYLVECYQSYGVGFILVLLALLGAFTYRSLKHRRALPEPQGLFWVALLITFAGIALNERCPNREPRYLIPFLPMLFGIAAAEGVALCRRISFYQRGLATAVLALTLLFPFRNVFQVVHETWAFSTSSVNVREISRFWNFVNRSEGGLTCRRILTCSSWSYDGGPGAFILNTRIDPFFMYCGRDKVQSAEKAFGVDGKVGDCFVLPGDHYPARLVQKLVAKEPSPQLIQQTFFE